MQPPARVGVERRPPVGRRERLGGAHPAGRGVEQLDGLLGRRAAADVPGAEPRVERGRVHRVHVAVQQAAAVAARRGSRGCRRRGARPPCGSREFGATFAQARHPPGDRRRCRPASKSSSASWAAARMCSTVLVEPPIATSRAIAFSNACRGGDRAAAAPSRRPRRSSAGPGRRPVRPASSNSARRAACVASVEPLPGSDSPSASVRQFIELAVNMPEHEPQVGQAERSTSVEAVVVDLRRTRTRRSR